MSERILLIGAIAKGERVDCSPFDGEAALDACRCVAVDPAAASALWAELAGQEMPDQAERAGTAHRLYELVQRRRREATELLRRGGTLLCFLRPVGPTLRLVRSGPKGATRTLLHAYSWLPEEPSLTRLIIAAAPAGEMHPADEGHPAWRLIRSQGGNVRPVACALNAPAPPHWHAIATGADGQLLAFEVRVGEGRVVFVPPLAVEDPRERGALLEQFFPPPSAAHEPPCAPEWVAALALPGQAELAARRDALAQQIEALEREFLDVRKRHSRLIEINRLLSARTGAELAGPAAAAFRLLGFRVEAAGATSLVLAADEGSAFVALAAGEEAIDSEAYWDLSRQIDAGPAGASKGIILANGFCSKRPDERGVVFPDLLRRGAQHRGVCLLEAPELYRVCAVLLARPEDAELRAKLRKALLETTGPCPLGELLPEEDEES